MAIFDKRLEDMGTVTHYMFAAEIKEGIPFHLSFGYRPVLLLQFKEKELGKRIKSKEYRVSKMEFEEENKVYQIFLEPKDNKVVDLEEFNRLRIEYLGVEIVLFFLREVL